MQVEWKVPLADHMLSLTYPKKIGASVAAIKKIN